MRKSRAPSADWPWVRVPRQVVRYSIPLPYFTLSTVRESQQPARVKGDMWYWGALRK